MAKILRSAGGCRRGEDFERRGLLEVAVPRGALGHCRGVEVRGGASQRRRVAGVGAGREQLHGRRRQRAQIELLADGNGPAWA